MHNQRILFFPRSGFNNLMCGWAGGLWKQSTVSLCPVCSALPSLRFQPFTLCNTEQTLYLVFQIESGRGSSSRRKGVTPPLPRCGPVRYKGGIPKRKEQPPQESVHPEKYIVSSHPPAHILILSGAMPHVNSLCRLFFSHVYFPGL